MWGKKRLACAVLVATNANKDNSNGAARGIRSRYTLALRSSNIQANGKISKAIKSV